MSPTKESQSAIGRAPEQLGIAERLAWAGKLIALEVYSPARAPLRRIEALGETIEECVAQLRERGLNPAEFEFIRLAPPF